MSFNFKARHIPSNTSCIISEGRYTLNECNLKAFFLGSRCEDKECKDCDKQPEIIEKYREGHECDRDP